MVSPFNPFPGDRRTKHIFVTGGVVSSLGKGLTAASIALLLERRGLSVRMQKLDPYLNVDPGTMSPYQHGEVYVLDDGSETDLDLGHYERFTDGPLTRQSNYTAGQIYKSVLEKERRGEYLGRTVQVVPHVTDEIKHAILDLAGGDVDVVITELGGTVGDIEGLPFLEAIRQIPLEVGRQNCLFLHLTLVPYLKAAREAKTKPTQHSVQQLRTIGIQPDMLVVRCERPLPREHTEKIAGFCNVERDMVVVEVDKEYSIYEVPQSLAEDNVDQKIVNRLRLNAGRLRLDDWTDLMRRNRHPEHEVTIAVVGKYIEHRDAYKSIYEALTHAGFAHSARVIFKRVDAESVEQDGAAAHLSGVDAILVPGGFGKRGIEGKILAVRFAREKGVPFFGICLGMQVAVVEFARNVLMLPHADSTEFAAETPDPVICLLEEQKAVKNMGGTMRLGAQPCVLTEDSKSAELYDTRHISERHRHRYEFNPAYRDQMIEHGLLPVGTSPDGTLVEIIEVPDHPWFIAVQFHPEFKSKPDRPHPLFKGFIGAALDRQSERSAAKAVATA